ncbi:hypothetical protein [Cellulomonas shaoxiangyii]|uniref:Uncharacterized protein n=1 Tax=Cellulomonas shaoxiangyii TaxID=2566013 RepID=A0A4P7SFB2_9CELL|nr:hypothetical protein [Cellulomonas shaoxiangyii]QCB92187.1 hypothetical protein E5225_00070 [Cellulomonas shaoxiangyii]TGY86402.1 hypothetical protein E5226_02500 [Cellulomonas shaoxiangyii]
MTIRGRARIADWIEVGLLVRGPRPLGLDPLQSFFESSIGLEPQQVNTGVREMARRGALLGARYPFKVHGEYAVQSTTDAARSTYMTAALMAPGNPVREYLKAAPDESMAVTFENLVASAAAGIWGDAGHALRFGWPSEIGRPPEFDAAINWLAHRIGVSVGQGYRQPRRRDGGVDVVAWRPFPDGRSGFPVLLVQCTLQENLLAKGMDVDTRLWSSWLAMDVDPTTALATPTVVPPGAVWNELALKYMVLDRIRLIGLSPAATAEQLAVDWVAATVEGLREHLEEIREL